MIQNRYEACSILDIPYNTSIKIANQKYRYLVKKLRPDLNGNEDIVKKFQKITEAIHYIRENTDNYPIYPVEFVITPLEKIKRKVKNLNINFSLLEKTSYKVQKYVVLKKNKVLRKMGIL